jgi:hypothetical protein
MMTSHVVIANPFVLAKQSIIVLTADRLLRFARNDGLAMTAS